MQHRHLIWGSFLFLALAASVVRAEPPKGIKVVVEAQRKEYFVGEPLVLKFGVTNTGDKPLKTDVGGDYRGGTRASRFVVTATDEHGHNLSDPDPVQMMFGGLSTSPEIAPGDTLWMPVFAMRYCLLDQPGTYTFRVGHDLGLLGGRWGSAPASQPDYPFAEITLRFVMPTEVQAQKIVDDQLHWNDSWSMYSNTRLEGDLSRHDFSTLRLPIYLKPLQKYAADGKAEVVAGIGSIETPEATRALIDLLLKTLSKDVAKAVVRPLDQRLPTVGGPGGNEFRIREDTTGRYEALIKATWRSEFAADLRAYCLAALKNSSDLATDATYHDYLYNAAHWLQCVGEKGDAPTVYDALDRALTTNEHTPNMTYPNEARNAGPLLNTAMALLARGAAPPAADRISAPALEIRRIRLDQAYRPAGWQGTLVAGINDARPYLRQVALETLGEVPQALPDAALPLLPRLVQDEDPLVRVAAMQAAGKSHDPVVGQIMLEMLAKSKDKMLLEYGGRSLLQMPQRAQWIEQCAARLTDAGLWDIFYRQLISGSLDGLSGGGGWSTPQAPEAAAAQKLWVDFIARHKEELAAGKKVPLDQADPGLAPGKDHYTRTDGGTWPAGRP